MYRTTYFTIKELVHPWILRDIGEETAWQRLDEGCLKDLDIIRIRWGTGISINAGANDSRGLRPPNDPDGAKYSMHKQGKAFDLVPVDGDVKGLYNLCESLMKIGILHSINTLENNKFTPTWVHVASHNISGTQIINP